MRWRLNIKLTRIYGQTDFFLIIYAYFFPRVHLFYENTDSILLSGDLISVSVMHSSNSSSWRCWVRWKQQLFSHSRPIEEAAVLFLRRLRAAGSTTQRYGRRQTTACPEEDSVRKHNQFFIRVHIICLKIWCFSESQVIPTHRKTRNFTAVFPTALILYQTNLGQLEPWWWNR